MAIYMKLTGIKGGSTHAKYKDHIQVGSASFSAHRSGTGRSGSGSSGGTAMINDMSFTKELDTASVELFKRVSGGGTIDEVEVKFTKSSGTDKEEVEFFRYKMKDAFITNWSTSAHAEQGGNATPMEQFTLSFKDLEIAYKSQDNKNAAAGEIIGQWSIDKNQ